MVKHIEYLQNHTNLNCTMDQVPKILTFRRRTCHRMIVFLIFRQLDLKYG